MHLFSSFCPMHSTSVSSALSFAASTTPERHHLQWVICCWFAAFCRQRQRREKKANERIETTVLFHLSRVGGGLSEAYTFIRGMRMLRTCLSKEKEIGIHTHTQTNTRTQICQHVYVCISKYISVYRQIDRYRYYISITRFLSLPS